jgi:hypothetical protein
LIDTTQKEIGFGVLCFIITKMNWNIKNDKIRELVSTFSPEIKEIIVNKSWYALRYIINGREWIYKLY